jgi:antitoxin MazE
LSFENGAIVLRKPATSVRVGWAEAAQALAAQGNEALLLDEFGNAGDSELVW